MRWQLVDVTKGGSEMPGSRKESFLEVYSLDLCETEGFISPETSISIYYISSEELAFKSRSSLLLGEEYPLEISYCQKKHKGQPDRVQTRILVVAEGKAPEGYWLYKAEFSRSAGPEIQHFFKFLKNLVEETAAADQKAQDEADRRRGMRILRALSVLSKDLSGFKVITTNISEGGIMFIMSGGDINKGDMIRLRLELDDYLSDPMYVKAEVCWVDASDPENLKVGVEFRELNESQQKVISNYITDVTEREKRYNF